MNGAPDLEVILDVREWRDELRGSEGLRELWSMIEGALLGRDLSTRAVHTLQHPNGDVRVDVARIRPGSSPVVGAGTAFHIVGVLEPPQVLYRCRICAERGDAVYAPFLCRECDGADGGNRLCDTHVRILDGALVATCDSHSPRCADCGRPAAFRCGGERCRRRRAYCAGHRVAHPHDADLAYCPACYAEEFPRCEVPACPSIGAVRCEVTDHDLSQCGIRVCAGHVRRWQVYGGESLGLGLCARHSRALPGFTAEELMIQIVLGTYLRTTRRRDAEALPSLRGFAHSLRNRGHRERALDYPWMHRTLDALENYLLGRGTGRDALRQLFHDRRDGSGRYRGRQGWREELDQIRRGVGQGEQLMEHLRGLLRQALPHDGPAIAATLRLAEYKPPRTHAGETRPALIFVHLPPGYRGAFIGARGANIRYFSERLSTLVPGGVVVRIEGDARSRRR